MNSGGLSFFRYSKVCFLEWAGSIALVVYGAINYAKTEDASDATGLLMMIGGIIGFFAFPAINEMFLNMIALCQKGDDPDEVKKRFS